MDLQCPEAFAVCDQLFRGEILATENKDVVFKEGRVYLREGLVVHAWEVDTDDLCAERSCHAFLVYGAHHGGTLVRGGSCGQPCSLARSLRASAQRTIALNRVAVFFLVSSGVKLESQQVSPVLAVDA